MERFKTTKTKTKTENVGIVKGAYDENELVILPSISKREQEFNAMIEALKNGKYFVLKAGYTKNSVYILLNKIKEKTDLQVAYANVQAKDGTKQFALFLKKEES